MDSLRIYATTALTSVCLLLLSIAVPWSILGNECLPGSNIFALIILFDVCILAGLLTKAISLPKIPPLPPLLGMLLAGVALRNIPYINVAKDIDPDWSSSLRSLALAVILIKAGLELDGSSLLSMKGVCLRLTAIPCLVEALTCCLVCYFILGFPWLWGLLLGFVLGAVTPAVIVPSLLELQKHGYGVVKGIPTLVIAASSFDDVLAITGFSVVLGITFSTADDQQTSSNTTDTGSELTTSFYFSNTTEETHSKSAGDIALLILRGPLEMLGGVLVGVLLGLFLWYIPSLQEKNVNRNRSLFVLGIGVLAVFGSRRIGLPGSGALIAIVTAFVAALRWKDEKEKISNFMSLLWRGFEPFLFGLIGAEVSFEHMDSSTVGGGIAVLFLCLLLRSSATFLATLGAGLNVKEQIFVCFAWLPKATVQAALGPIALDTARNLNLSESAQKMARQVLTITVLAILITAPLGAAAIALSGPKLLSKEMKQDNASSSPASLPLNEISIEARNSTSSLKKQNPEEDEAVRT